MFWEVVKGTNGKRSGLFHGSPLPSGNLKPAHQPKIHLGPTSINIMPHLHSLWICSIALKSWSPTNYLISSMNLPPQSDIVFCEAGVICFLLLASPLGIIFCLTWAIHSFIQAFNIYLLGTYYLPGTLLDSGFPELNKMFKFPLLMEPTRNARLIDIYEVSCVIMSVLHSIRSKVFNL